MTPIEYYIVDVFANQKYQGNQLAVFLDQDDQLDQHQMQNAATEIGFAETTFIKSRQTKEGSYLVKIFDPVKEIPFAGHPTLGTAFIIGDQLPDKRPDLVTLKLTVGEIPVSLNYVDNVISELTMKQVQPIFGKTFNASDLAKVFNLNVIDFDHNNPIMWVTTGLPYIIVPLQSLSSTRKINIDDQLAVDFLNKHQLIKSSHSKEITTSFFLFATEAIEDSNDIHARMLWYDGRKFVEDAATGSANGCLLAYLLKHQIFDDNNVDLTVEQGFKINRPSFIKLNGSKTNDNYDIFIGGKCHLISKGTWYFD